jgi:hypothetical protein
VTARPALAAASGVLMCSLVAGCASAEEAGAGAATPGVSPPASTAAPEQPPASGSEAPASGSEAPAAADRATSADDGALTREITITGREVTPAPEQVPLAPGEVLRLVVTSDVPNELHVHGLGDVETELVPGRPTTVELVGTEPGVYEVETHSPQLQLLQVAVR